MTNDRSTEQTDISDARQNYWRDNLRIVVGLLTIWFVVGYLASILFVEWFNELSIGKLPLGFWFAQQGSIVVFVLLVFVYARLMDGLDRRFARKRGL
ncbi:MAG TPA: DUF4212 domain-containing protein [Pirellulaceae bacterium]|nr:DUF4212 domain-containing protein [Pirellulaceae bacterium]HMO92627.1 DUF4212 domain-containing protein [Pirellulaceae bacterium]HMP70225.1 DUF4212 domain-containing protein [Pirellulaceae bacterium]